MDDKFVDDLLRQAAGQRLQPSDDLMTRIVADADSLSVQRHDVRVRENRGEQKSLVRSLLTAIGGWPALAGLTTATCAGLWIGFASPGGISELTEDYFAAASYDLADFMPQFIDSLEEG